MENEVLKEQVRTLVEGLYQSESKYAAVLTEKNEYLQLKFTELLKSKFAFSTIKVKEYF
jgi:hypothetical protein